jgi:hypothetical protein
VVLRGLTPALQMPKWKRFERLTAALHVLKTRGAEVKWNVECKDHKSPVEQGEVAEFVVKCKKTGANKGIMVSASGFQSGAARLAQEEGIEIFTLNEVAADWPDRVQASVLVPYVVNVRFQSASGAEVPISDKLGDACLANIVVESRQGQRFQDHRPRRSNRSRSQVADRQLSSSRGGLTRVQSRRHASGGIQRREGR